MVLISADDLADDMNHGGNILGTRVGQDELRQEARQETHSNSPATPSGCTELAPRLEEFVDDEHYRPAGKREEQNGD